MNRTVATSCWSGIVGVFISGAAGCDSQRPADYGYQSDLLASEPFNPETNTNWIDHAREREQQAKWDRDRTYYDYDFREHHRDSW